MADIAPMLGAILGVKHSPKAKAAKSKSKNAAKKVAIVVHTESPLANAQDKAPTDRHMLKEHAKNAVRRATEDWVSGHISTKECSAAHDRAKHVLSGRSPREFKGMSGERSFKKMR